MIPYQIAIITLFSVLTFLFLLFLFHQYLINRRKVRKHSPKLNLATTLKWRKIRNKKIKEDLEIKKVAAINREIEKEIKKGE